MSESCAITVHATHALLGSLCTIFSRKHGYIEQGGLGVERLEMASSWDSSERRPQKRPNTTLTWAESGMTQQHLNGTAGHLPVSELNSTNHHHWPGAPFLRPHFPALPFLFLANSLLPLERRRPPSLSLWRKAGSDFKLKGEGQGESGGRGSGPSRAGERKCGLLQCLSLHLWNNT